MSYDLKNELSKLKDFVFQNYDPVQISVKAMEIYNEYALQLSTFSSEKLMILAAMDMGEEFELSKDEVEDLLDVLLRDTSINLSS
ncbi:hypothetical protein NT90_18735 [Acinetobacter baumannii]|uniref:MafI family immunity protein n=1 Tax=Acinetobacter seifertii TaxID=1530123 RepID=A0A7H2Q3T6_9GAMM|nr:hypothetical protein [Acinetobacter genomosp. 33YU]KHO13897.1 hypothetical protein NT90_18735 [Acinetobacter baumannii]QNX09769.1 hypothetical protein IC795_06305 [Acinetobacter seifertii]ONN50797.1 hypothetical protein AC056_05115 [Acinetobacter genomosp. 33YU]QNX49869.1 hypothetical protein IC784_06420 [Acinetobacter seifertii]QNY18352.1 hypothetical protein IC765_06965 [Acinetobacter seifertii]